MKHNIIVKFKPEITKKMQQEMYADIYEIFEHTLEIDGVNGIRLIPNVIDRDNRYHLVIEMDMEKEALPVYDNSMWHKLWKEQYGNMLELKTIIDLDDAINTLTYTPDEGRYDGRMPYPYLGKSGLKIPEISLGLWNNFGDVDNYNTMKSVLHTAFDLGINHFDLANNYGPPYGSAEKNFGKIMKESFTGYRDELLISTKAGYDMWPGPYGNHGSRKYLLSSLDQSLKRMGLDYVDIFYHHRPDPDTPLDETMGALATAVHSGKALYAGLSRYSGEEMRKAAKILKELNCPFVINQVRYSIFDRTFEDNGLFDAAYADGKGVIVFSPLEQGLLTDKYLMGVPKDSRIARHVGTLTEDRLTYDRLKQLNKLNDLAHSRGQSLAQLALSWVKQNKAVTSILVGASKPSQVVENCKIIGAPKLTAEEMKLIEDIWKEYPVHT